MMLHTSMMMWQIFICFFIFSAIFCQALSTVDDNAKVITERPLGMYPYSNGGGRMIERPRRRKPKSTKSPEIRFKRSPNQPPTLFLEPLADAALEAAFSQEQLPLDRYPKRSRNRVSEGF